MARPLRGPNGEEVIVTRLNPARASRLVQQAKAMEKAFEKATGKGGFIEDTNRRSLHWIQAKAVENLKQSIKTNRRPDFTTGRLERAIADDANSNVTPTHIEFLIRSKIFPKVPYYASLEFGDRSQIGRNIYFLFLGARSAADAPNFSSDHRRNFNRVQAPSDVRNNRSPHVPHTIQDYGDGGLHASRRSKTVTYSGANTVSDRLVGPREYGGRAGKANAFRTKPRRVIIRRPVPKYAYGQKAVDLFLSSKQYKTILDEADASFRATTGRGLK